MKIYLAIGGLGERGCEVLKQAGAVRALYSFADVAAKEKAPLLLPEMMLDSGAYSAATEKGYMRTTFGAYKLWLQIHLDKYPMVVTYVNFDDLHDPKQTLENQQSMEADGLKPLPVYHYGEPESVLDYYCSKYEYVGLGGLAIGRITTGKLKKFWDYTAEKYPDNKFHLFGATAMGAFYTHQPYSMDSLTWVQNAIHGRVAGYKDGLPAVADFSRVSGWELFTEWKELCLFNARAIIDYEKLEWLKNIKKVSEENTGNQGRLF